MMSEFVTSTTIETCTRHLALALIAHTANFNELDAVGGDGDMGTTLATISRALLKDEDEFPSDLGASFARLANVIAKTSGSSLSAVILTGLMAMSQKCAGRTKLEWQELSALIAAALGVMQTRSKAQLGDKTILDGLAAIADATANCKSGVEFAAAAPVAVTEAVENFRDRPVLIGRLRLEPGKGCGHEDPGMAALKISTNVLANIQDAKV
jgi:dihydroxyacetone kinase-like protein